MNLKRHMGGRMCVSRELWEDLSVYPAEQHLGLGRMWKQEGREGWAEGGTVLLSCLLVPSPSPSHRASVSASVKWGQWEMGLSGNHSCSREHPRWISFRFLSSWFTRQRSGSSLWQLFVFQPKIFALCLHLGSIPCGICQAWCTKRLLVNVRGLEEKTRRGHWMVPPFPTAGSTRQWMVGLQWEVMGMGEQRAFVRVQRRRNSRCVKESISRQCFWVEGQSVGREGGRVRWGRRFLLSSQWPLKGLHSFLLPCRPSFLSLPPAEFRRMEFKARLKLEDREDRSRWGSKWVCIRDQISRGLKCQYSFWILKLTSSL